MKKVLIVDDVPLMRQLLVSSFGKYFDVAESHSADAALGIIKQWQPDAVLLDIQMPGLLNGLDLCNIIKCDATLAHIYVMMVTGDWDSIKEAGHQLRADDFYLKPVNVNKMITIVQDALSSNAESQS